MAKTSLLAHAWEVYTRNFWLIVLMAVPGLFGLAIPLLVGTPSFVALGGAYLRTNSIPDLTPLSSGLMVLSLIVSLFLMSFAIVNINLVIKSQRTLTQIGNEVAKSATTTTLSVFWIFLMASISLLIIQLLTYEYGLQSVLAPLLSLAIGLAILFVPTAMVIDDVRPYRALQRSINTVLSKSPLVLLWLLVAFVSLVAVDAVFLFVLPHPFASWLVLIVNSVLIHPYLIVLLGQIYISKYTILE